MDLQSTRQRHRKPAVRQTRLQRFKCFKSRALVPAALVGFEAAATPIGHAAYLCEKCRNYIVRNYMRTPAKGIYILQ